MDHQMNIISDIKLQWGEPIASIAYISTGWTFYCYVGCFIYVDVI